MSELLGRVPPQSLEAEMSVLGCMLLDNDTIFEVRPLVQANFFYRKANQSIYETICEVFDSSEPVDSLILRQKLKTKRLLEEVGGSDYLASLVEAVPSSANAVYYAQVVRQKALLRTLIVLGNDLLRRGYEGREQPEALAQQAEAKLSAVAYAGVMEDVVRLKDVLPGVVQGLRRMVGQRNAVLGLATGFLDLDKMLTGFKAGELIVLAGRPGMGKTTLALNLALGAARLGHPVGIITLEQSRGELVRSLLACHARVDVAQFMRGFGSAEDMARIELARPGLSAAPLVMTDMSRMTPSQIRGMARRMVAKHAVELVVLDYLQLVGADQRVEDLRHEVTLTSRGLKALAKELQIPVLAVSQLNRMPDVRADHRPRLADLKESGSIEQDADAVLLLYRSSYYAREETRDMSAEVIVAKQRNGPMGPQVRLPFVFEGKYRRFLQGIEGENR